MTGFAWRVQKSLWSGLDVLFVPRVSLLYTTLPLTYREARFPPFSSPNALAAPRLVQQPLARHVRPKRKRLQIGAFRFPKP